MKWHIDLEEFSKFVKRFVFFLIMRIFFWFKMLSKIQFDKKFRLFFLKKRANNSIGFRDAHYKSQTLKMYTRVELPMQRFQFNMKMIALSL